MTTSLKPYTIEDLAAAVADYAHAKGTHKELVSLLKARRDAIKSLENDEAIAAADLDRHAAKVHSIAKALK